MCGRRPHCERYSLRQFKCLCVNAAKRCLRKDQGNADGKLSETIDSLFSVSAFLLNYILARHESRDAISQRFRPAY